jgi:hypothetical protein
VARPRVVCGPIHDDNYLILVELDGSYLYVRLVDDTIGVLDRRYQLGSYFDLTITAAAGYVDAHYNGEQKAHARVSAHGCYFKAGCYVQSNEHTGNAPTAFAQVRSSDWSSRTCRAIISMDRRSPDGRLASRRRRLWPGWRSVAVVGSLMLLATASLIVVRA